MLFRPAREWYTPKSRPPRVKTGCLSALVQIFENTMHAEEQHAEGISNDPARHVPGSQLARECPFLQAERRRGIGDQRVDKETPSRGVVEALPDEPLEREF